MCSLGGERRRSPRPARAEPQAGWTVSIGVGPRLIRRGRPAGAWNPQFGNVIVRVGSRVQALQQVHEHDGLLERGHRLPVEGLDVQGVEGWAWLGLGRLGVVPRGPDDRRDDLPPPLQVPRPRDAHGQTEATEHLTAHDTSTHALLSGLVTIFVVRAVGRGVVGGELEEHGVEEEAVRVAFVGGGHADLCSGQNGRKGGGEA